MSPILRWARVAARPRLKHCVLLISGALVTQSCSLAPHQPLTGPDPADTDVRVPTTFYRSTLRYRHGIEPAEPSPWTKSGPPSRQDTKKP
jgi:hypothetical protein